MLNYLKSPFDYIAGEKALFIGMLVLLGSAILGYFGGVRQDGILDAHLVSSSTPIYFYIIEVLLNVVILGIALFIAGKIISASKFRVVDLFGTLAFARIPMFFVVLLFMFMPLTPEWVEVNIQELMNPSASSELIFSKEMIITLIIAFSALPFIIYFVYLCYKAYSISCNVTGAKSVLSFITALFVAEIVSKVLYYFIF